MATMEKAKYQEWMLDEFVTLREHFRVMQGTTEYLAHSQKTKILSDAFWAAYVVVATAIGTSLSREDLKSAAKSIEELSRKFRENGF
jgi:hypothetical protein